MLAALATVGMQPPVRAYGHGPLRIHVPSNVFQDALAVYNYQNQLRARVTSAGDFSNNGGQSGCEVFGAGATVGGADCTAIGSGASAGGASSVNNLAVGRSATANVAGNSDATAVGDAANARNRTTSVGRLAGASSTATNSVFIGKSAGAGSSSSPQVSIGDGASATAGSQCVIGSTLTTISEMYVGNGVTNASPLSTSVNASGGSGTNIAGADLAIAGGKGTGNAAGGNVLIQTSTAGGSGTTLQTLATVAEFGPATIGFYGVTPAARPSAYTPTNVTTDRAYDANATTLDEVADVLGTVIADLQSLGLLQ